MDENLKTMIDDYTEIEYRYGKLNGMINSVISMCEYELIHKGKERWHTDVYSVDVPAALVLHMLGREIPQNIEELYQDSIDDIPEEPFGDDE